MNGLLDFIKTPEGQGLLSAAFGGLAGARRGQPLNSIGRAGLAGLTGYGNAQDRQAQELEQMQNRELRTAQVAKYKQDLSEAQKAAEQKARVEGLISAAFGPASGITANVRSGIAGPRPEALEATAAPDYQKLIAMGVPFSRLEELSKAKNLGRSKVARTAEVEGPDGTKRIVQLDEFGGEVGPGMAGYVAPVQVNTSDRVTFTKPSAGQSFSVGMSPSDKDASRRGWANIRQGERRLSFDQGGGVDGAGSSQAGLVKMYGKPSAGYRWKSDGSQEFIPGGPADQKAQLQKSGEGTVGSVVADLRDKYNLLNEGGGIVSTGKDMLSNIAARTSASGVGQTIGGAVGTKNQSARDSVAMTRPLLLQAIMKATGMSAKQMDSNAELKLYLATATDPTLGYEANMQALDRIENLYGGGASMAPSGNGKPAQSGFADKSKEQRYQEWKRSQGK